MNAWQTLALGVIGGALVSVGRWLWQRGKGPSDD